MLPPSDILLFLCPSFFLFLWTTQTITGSDTMCEWTCYCVCVCACCESGLLLQLRSPPVHILTACFQLSIECQKGQWRCCLTSVTQCTVTQVFNKVSQCFVPQIIIIRLQVSLLGDFFLLLFDWLINKSIKRWLTLIKEGLLGYLDEISLKCLH